MIVVRRHTAVSAVVSLVALMLAALSLPTATLAADPSGGCVTAASVTTCTFDYTGAIEHWTVPAGVTEVTVDAYGAAGGTGLADNPGGQGAQVHVVVPVAGGDVLDVTVGGQGSVYPAGPTNAFGGGGSSLFGGGGGGGSFVYDGATALVIAAGGGGGGEDFSGGTGGIGGDSGSGGGAAASHDSVVGSTGGGAGTSSAGGGGGQQNDCGTVYAGGAGGDGSEGQGGSGGDGGQGGGGGGGYYGGGGGAGIGLCVTDWSGSGGGGGGSSYTDPSATDVSVVDGAQSGDGMVTIEYTSPDDVTAPTVNGVAAVLDRFGRVGSASIALFWDGNDDVTAPEDLVFQTQVRRMVGGSWSAWHGKRTYHGVGHSSPEIALWRTFQYRARARDEAGNWSDWVESNTVSAFRRRETQLHLTGSWSIVAQAGATRHKVARSSTPGDSAWLGFNGDGATFVMPVNSGQGSAEICIDPGTLDEDCFTVDIGALTPTGNKRFVDVQVGLTPGDHVLKLTVVSGTVDLDGAVFTRGSSSG